MSKKVRFKIFPEVADWRSLEVGSRWDWFLVLRRRLTRAYSLLLLGMILLGVGFVARPFLVGFATLSTLAFFSFIWLRDAAHRLRLQRTAPYRAREDDIVKFDYVIENGSRLPLWSFTLRDNFEGTAEGTIVETSTKWLGGLRRRRMSLEAKCDQGMGRFRTGPLRLELTDPLGLFVFEIVEDEISVMEVYPRVGTLPDIQLKGRHDSDYFGIYEQLSAGGSVNFMGIRPYVPGDPLKTVSWKLSSKFNELMVKVFDRSVSDEVTLILDFSPEIQMGYRKESTWAVMKDLGLRLIRQCIDNGNRVQVASQHLYLPWGAGADHWARSTMTLSMVDPDFSGDDPGTPLPHYHEIIPMGSTVFFVTPITHQNRNSLKDLLFRIRARPADVFLFLVDSYSFINAQVPGLEAVASFSPDAKEASTLEDFRLELARVEIQSYLISRNQDMARAILESAL